MSKQRFQYSVDECDGSKYIYDNVDDFDYEEYQLEAIVDVLNEQDDKISNLEAKLAESENKHLLAETEWQDYCAFKHIEPQIKGCLDREREYKNQLAKEQKHISRLKNMNKSHDEAVGRLTEENNQLKQQLFESGLKTLEEIKLSEQRKKMLEDLSTKNWELEHQLAEKEKESLKYFNEYRAWKSKCELIEQDQTKILETNQDKISFAVEQLEKVKEWMNQSNDEGYIFRFSAMDIREMFNQTIDNQIKQLKEGK